MNDLRTNTDTNTDQNADQQRDYETAMKEAETMASLALSNATRANNGRMQMATNLLNLWNTGVQVQANRALWTTSDFKTFMIALAALDSVGATAVAQAENTRVNAETTQASIQASVQSQPQGTIPSNQEFAQLKSEPPAQSADDYGVNKALGRIPVKPQNLDLQVGSYKDARLPGVSM